MDTRDILLVLEVIEEDKGGYTVVQVYTDSRNPLTQTYIDMYEKLRGMLLGKTFEEGRKPLDLGGWHKPTRKELSEELAITVSFINGCIVDAKMAEDEEGIVDELEQLVKAYLTGRGN